ncbi:hypothetical protein [Thioalkalivibrio sp. ALE20]|uniref:hypothetical protein n=1 Tax=Thioalkalivibrio sp. ALE20 TaxID=545275 RepID=UPI000370E505|nr:hypothetical protein [Thioalkalivibrio sp. ALE20]
MTDTTGKPGHRTRARLESMPPEKRQAAIKAGEARLTLINAAREAGYPLKTREQIQHALNEMRKAAKD